MARDHRRVVIAIGGNALADPGELESLAHQDTRARDLATALADVIASDQQVVLVHGNGPQVGEMLLRNEPASEHNSPSPLHVCVAETQGQIGHFLEIALVRELAHRGVATPVATLLTHVTVDPIAPELTRPDKPVGSLYSESEARRLASMHGWHVAHTPRGWRRVVASPHPAAILEHAALRGLLDKGVCVIAGGGGGIPISAHDYQGIGAVVDKDYTAQLVAAIANAARLIILTDVPGAALSFGSGSESYLRRVTAAELAAHQAAGEFAPGSMAPKVEACLAFLNSGGQLAVIAALDDAPAALNGESGTVIVPVS